MNSRIIHSVKSVWCIEFMCMKFMFLNESHLSYRSLSLWLKDSLIDIEIFQRLFLYFLCIVSVYSVTSAVAFKSTKPNGGYNKFHFFRGFSKSFPFQQIFFDVSFGAYLEFSKSVRKSVFFSYRWSVLILIISIIPNGLK